MLELTLTNDDDFNFHLPITIAIAKYSGTFFHEIHGLPHPGALLNRKWSNFVDNINIFLNLYEDYIDATKFLYMKKQPYTPHFDSDITLSKVITAYEIVIYKATELIEMFTTNRNDNICRSMLIEEQWKKWNPDIPSRLKDYPTVTCNKIKHNHNIISPIEADYALGRVIGYAVYEYGQNNSVKLNKNIHKENIPFSFGADLRKILTNIFLISKIIYDELGTVCNLSNSVNLNNLSMYNKNIELYRRISKFMPLSFYLKTKAKHIPIFSFNEKELKISETGGKLINPGNGIIKTHLSGDGYTKQFPYF